MKKLISAVFSAGLMCCLPSAYANKALANKNGCLGCHAVDVQINGPAYKDVAQKYASDPKAKEHLVQSILQGGSGRWGEMAMPPQTKLIKSDANKLADWILRGAH